MKYVLVIFFLPYGSSCNYFNLILTIYQVFNFKCYIFQFQKLLVKKQETLYIYIYMYIYIYICFIAKSIGSPPSNERFDYFSNVLEYKS